MTRRFQVRLDPRVQLAHLVPLVQRGPLVQRVQIQRYPVQPVLQDPRARTVPSQVPRAPLALRGLQEAQAQPDPRDPRALRARTPQFPDLRDLPVPRAQPRRFQAQPGRLGLRVQPERTRPCRGLRVQPDPLDRPAQLDRLQQCQDLPDPQGLLGLPDPLDQPGQRAHRGRAPTFRSSTRQATGPGTSRLVQKRSASSVSEPAVVEVVAEASLVPLERSPEEEAVAVVLVP